MDRRLIGAAAALAMPAYNDGANGLEYLGTSTSIALQTGSGFAWCQPTWGSFDADYLRAE